ncbi:hypothetical protein [Caulobacter soli]|uniref:hypothetical protein n=1 Tax=Caulobacter soli TaxID=2708539 RepID=UPI0013ED6DE5|nr:hypothetical protein [Caulobacter soli]
MAASTLVVAFSSLGRDQAGLGYEFERLAERDDCSVLLLRDVATSWYHAVPGVEGGVEGLARFLAGRTEGYERTVFLGYSMGGYAALLYGRLLAADAILAFAPQTLLAAEPLADLGDRRWPEQLSRVQAARPVSPYLDLAPLYAAPELAAPGQAMIYTAADGEDAVLDLAHAHRLAPHARVVQIGEAPLAHAAPLAALRASDLLRQVFDGAIGGDPPSPAEIADRYVAWASARRHALALDAAGPTLSADGRLRLAGTVTNVSPVPIRLAEGVRVGARLWRNGETGPHVDEHRFIFSDTAMAPGAVGRFAFDLALSGLASGRYDLSVALVHEGRGWFDDLGFPSAMLTFDAHPFALTEVRTFTGLRASRG